MNRPAPDTRGGMELRRLNRALRMLSGSNQALLRAPDEETLLREVCRVAVEVGGYDLAWVGLPQNDERRTVRIAAAAGGTDALPDAARLVWAEGPGDPDPAGAAIRTGTACIARAPSESHGRRGHAAVAAVPLVCERRTLGALNVHSAEPHAFDAGEMQILAELAADLAFGLEALRRRAEHERAEELLHRREQEFRAFVENSPDLILRFDRELRETYVNPALCRTFGLPAEAFLGLPVGEPSRRRDFPGGDVAIAEVRRCIESVFATGEPTELEVNWPTPGGPRDFSVRYFPERGRDGAVTSVLSIARDITPRKRAEEALRASEARFRTFVDQTAEAFFLHDAEGTILDANRQACASLGYTSEELVGMHPSRFDTCKGPEEMAAIEARINGGESVTFESRHRRKDGSDFPVEVHIRSFLQDGKRFAVSLAHDITSRVRAQEEIRAREREFRSLAENTPDIIVRWNRELKRVYVNPAFAAAMRVDRALLLGGVVGSDYGGAETPGAAAEVVAAVKRVFAGGRQEEALITWPTPEGEHYHYVRFIPESDGAGNVATVLGIGRDVTVLKESEEQLRALTENSPDFIARVDREHRYLYANRVIERYTGTPAAEHLGRRMGEVAADTSSAGAEFAAELQPVHEAIDRVFATGEPAVVEGRVRFPLADVVLEGRFMPEFGHDAGVASVLILARDVTERRRTEEALRLSQEQYASLVNTVDGIVWEAGAEDFEFTFVSTQAERILGYKPEQWTSQPGFWQAHIHPDDRTATVAYCAAATREGRDHDFQYRMVAADGRVVWMHDVVTVVVENGRPVKLRGIMIDITDRKRADEALRDSEQRFRQVTEAIDEVYWLTDVAKDRIIYISPAYERIWGRTCTSLREEPHSWLESIHPGDRERVQRAATTLQDRGDYDIEYRIVRPDGAVRWIHDRAFPIREADGTVSRIAGVAEDFTKRRQLEEQLRQSQKMEAIGQLAGGVAHDFNNLLTVVQMQTSFLLDELRDEAAAQGLRQIMDAARRAANLTRQLLTFSRQQPKAARMLDLGEVAAGTTELLRRVLGEDVHLDGRFGYGLPAVHADPGMMEQVLMNLVINARDAMPDGGRLTIALDAVTLDAARAAANPSARPGRFVRLEVSDTGSGIAPENMRRIFEPFFTTKEVGKGTGLGLALVFGIVEQHHGWIEVESTVGKGTTFRVFIPAAEGSAAGATAAPAKRATGGSETVLLVEDEPTVRAVAGHALRRAGYKVLEAANAQEALRMWEERGGTVDLLLTDLVMPGGVTGAQLARELGAARPGLRTIYTSGYNRDAATSGVQLAAGRNFLPKPYLLTELLSIVRRRLDEG